MRVLVHDYSGHPFQVQLSQELARRGHTVIHSHCEAYRSGKGHLRPEPGETVRFAVIGVGRSVAKYWFVKRFFQECSLGVELARLIHRERPEVVLIANTPLPVLVIATAYLGVRRTPWLLWHQDVQTQALRSLSAVRGSLPLRLVANVMEATERWCARRAAHIIVIADSFLKVHARWGTLHKTTLVPNWAPLEDIAPRERHNPWAAEQCLGHSATLLYAGTLGLKHNPALLVSLARRVRDLGTPVALVVVNEGPAVEVLRVAAKEHDVPITLLPFQPYGRLPEVLAAGDVLVVLLEQDASGFSVPSKTLSYLCAGRPIVGLMPEHNAAAQLLAQASCLVLPPEENSIDEAADWVVDILGNPARAAAVGRSARQLAEAEFPLDSIASRFEKLLIDAAHSSRTCGL